MHIFLLDNDLSDLASIICGVPRGFVLRPLKLYLYLLPRSYILKYHKIVIMFMLTILNFIVNIYLI